MSDLPFGFAKPEDSPGFLLWQTIIIWQRRIKSALDYYEISHAQFVMMATLMWFEERGDVTQVMLVNQTKLDKMTVSKSLRSLALAGYVIRIEDSKDTRAKLVSLTEKGKDMVKILVPIVENIDSEFFNVFDDKETEEVLKIFIKLTQFNNSSY